MLDRTNDFNFRFPIEYIFWLVPEALATTPSKITYSKKEIEDDIFGSKTEMEHIKNDLPRTPWVLGKNNQPSWFGSVDAGPESTINAMADNQALPLTKEEARALCAFALTNGNKEASQAGFFRGPTLFLSFWLSDASASLDIQSDFVMHVTRHSINELHISYTLVLFPKNSNNLNKWGNVSNDVKKSNALCLYTNRYTLQQKGGDFTLTRMHQSEDQTLHIQKPFFLDTFLPELLKDLDAAKTEQDFKKFVPWLAYKPFADAFFQKLHLLPANEKIVDTLLKGIALCFPLSLWEKHAGKITSLIIVSLMVSAAIPLSIIFILPNLLGILSSTAFFSITAVAMLAIYAVGGLIGYAVDQNRTWFIDTLLAFKKAFANHHSDTELQKTASSTEENIQPTSDTKLPSIENTPQISDTKTATQQTTHYQPPISNPPASSSAIPPCPLNIKQQLETALKNYSGSGILQIPYFTDNEQTFINELTLPYNPSMNLRGDLRNTDGSIEHVSQCVREAYIERSGELAAWLNTIIPGCNPKTYVYSKLYSDSLQPIELNETNAKRLKALYTLPTIESDVIAEALNNPNSYDEKGNFSFGIFSEPELLLINKIIDFCSIDKMHPACKKLFESAQAISNEIRSKLPPFAREDQSAVSFDIGKNKIQLKEIYVERLKEAYLKDKNTLNPKQQ